MKMIIERNGNKEEYNNVLYLNLIDSCFGSGYRNIKFEHALRVDTQEVQDEEVVSHEIIMDGNVKITFC